MAMANMNLIGVFVTKLWPVQACGGGDGGGGDGAGGATKTIISPKFSNFGDIITQLLYWLDNNTLLHNYDIYGDQITLNITYKYYKMHFLFFLLFSVLSLGL